MPDFHEVRFPDEISKGSQGGPERRTDIVELVSGFEERNAAQAHSKRSYDAGMGIRDINDLYDVIAFWEARLGQLYGFRWKDWSDYKSGKPKGAVTNLDQQLGTGTGAKTQFQLQKAYTSGPVSYVRPIKKPVAGTVVVALNGVNQPSGWTVDTTTGIVTFTAAPGNGVAVSAGFQFDVPVRFGASKLSISVEAFNAGSLPSIDIVEVRV